MTSLGTQQTLEEEEDDDTTRKTRIEENTLALPHADPEKKKMKIR